MAEPFVWILAGARKYRCAFGLEQYRELERICNAGTGMIRSRVSAGRYGFADGEVHPELAEYRVLELWEIVRQGVIGGGMMALDGVEQKIDGSYYAEEYLRRYYFGLSDDRVGLTVLWAHAYQIIMPLCEGFDPPKKAEPVKEPATPTKSSTSRRRSPTAP